MVSLITFQSGCSVFHVDRVFGRPQWTGAFDSVIASLVLYNEICQHLPENKRSHHKVSASEFDIYYHEYYLLHSEHHHQQYH